MTPSVGEGISKYTNSNNIVYNTIFKIKYIFAGSFKSQLIDYFSGHIVSW